MDIGSIILAGGKSSRFGKDKSSITLGNRSLLEIVLSRIAGISSHVIVVIAGEQVVSLSTHLPGLRIISDRYPGRGPLGGIISGLQESPSRFNLVVASDMPFLSLSLLDYMVKLADSADIVVPRMGDYVEPLHAVYSRTCLNPMIDMITNNDLKISNLFARVQVRYIDCEEIERFDPRHLSFFNINTKDDLKKAMAIYQRKAQ